MSTPTGTSTPIHAAARRLRGHLVDTPVIGEIRLPGFRVAPTVRVKVEALQTAGSAWYRGYLHHLLRSLGRFKGIVLHGEPRVALAQAFAGAFHRLPMHAVCDSFPGEFASMLAGLGCDVESVGSDAPAVASRRAAELGFRCLPFAEDEDIATGVATLGLELGEQLPSDLARVVVPDEGLVGPVRAGLVAAGRSCEVCAAVGGGFPESWAVAATAFPAAWRSAVGAGMRIVPDDTGLAGLWTERDAALQTCVVV